MNLHKYGANVIRAHAFYQLALGMWADRWSPDRPYGEIRLALGARALHADRPPFTIAVDVPDGIGAVARGEADLTAVNPSAYLTMAVRGVGPFAKPLALSAVGVMPSWDFMAFVVADRTGLTSLADIRERRYPLKVSVRANDADPTRFVVDQVLQSAGFSLQDLESWGGSIQKVPVPRDPVRLDAIADGTIDAVFDEGIAVWLPVALRHGMRPLPIDAAAQQRMRELGWPIGPITQSRFPELTADVPAISFSGWALCVREGAPDALAYAICRVLDEQRGEIPWDTDAVVQLIDIRGGTEESPLDVPLHPGAARYYAEHGIEG